MEKKYYAFISYKREDEEWAKWVQEEFEKYLLPASLNGRDDLPKAFHPVFRDIDELKAGNLPGQIYNALASSLNLVVICSPRLANDDSAKWVNKEIMDFIEIGKKEGVDNVRHIFPFIVEGKPHAGDERECLPKALRELAKEQERIGGNINEGGDVSEINRERAFVKVLAGTLPDSVSFDMLWDRYDRAKMERERKEKEERDKLLKVQSRFVAQKAMELIEDGDSYLARRLVVSVLPKDLESPDRPYIAEAEFSFRKACSENSAILRGFVDIPGSVSLSQDEKIIATVPWQAAIEHGDLGIWDIHTGFCWKPSKVTPEDARLRMTPRGVRFSSDGKKLTLDMSQGYILTYDLESKTIINKVDKTNDEFFLMSPDGKLKWDYRNSNVITSVASNKQKCVLQGYQYSVGQEIVLSADGKCLAIKDFAKVVAYDMETGARLLCVSEDQEIESVSFSPTGKYVVTTVGRTIKIWNLADKQCVKTFNGHTATVSYATFTLDGKRVVSTSMDRTMRLWDFEKDDDCQTLSDNMGWVYFATFSADNKLIATASMDGKVRVWDANSHQCMCRFVGHSNEINYVAFSPDGKHLASASKDKTIFIWNIEKKTYEHVLYGHWENVAALSYSPDGNCLVSSSWDKTIKIWDVHTGNCINTFAHGGRTVSYSPDGEKIIVVDGRIYILDAKTGVVIKRLVGHREVAFSAFFSFDGRMAVSASEDRTVRIWDVETEQCIHILSGHTGWIYFASFSPDGKLVVSASEDKTVRVWDVGTGICIRVFEGHNYDVKSAVFSSDGKKIVSAACDRTFKIWNFPPLQDLIDQTRERFKDCPLTSEERKQYYLE